MKKRVKKLELKKQIIKTLSHNALYKVKGGSVVERLERVETAD